MKAGKLHEDFKGEGGRLVGKCTDLESAYKQCPIAAKHAHVAIFAVKNPATGKAEFFEACALPFGAAAAVHGFNRVATSLNYVMHFVIAAACSHYFDDFTFVMPKVIANV